MGFELEVKFLNAVGQLLVVDLELELGDLGCVEVCLVHSIKLMQEIRQDAHAGYKHQGMGKKESDQGLTFVFFVFAVGELSPEDEEGGLNDIQPDSRTEEDIAMHLEERAGGVLEDYR